MGGFFQGTLGLWGGFFLRARVAGVSFLCPRRVAYDVYAFKISVSVAPSICGMSD